MDSLSHIDKAGNAKMVDVGDKAITERIATAQTVVNLPKNIVALFENGDLHSKKGPVFHTAKIAGIMAVKKTSELIPMCHPLIIDNCSVDINMNNNQQVVINCTVKIQGKTGVEMEALTGASIAALTIYDMCKAMSQDIIISETKLMRKTGGKNAYTRD